MPHVFVISGPNGAGKSTLAPYLLRDIFDIVEYVNADTIAQGLSAFAPENASFEAGRIMLTRIKELAEQKRDFAFETTLATRSYFPWLRGLQDRGYRVHLVFLWLESADLGIERVKERVRLGGHDVPHNTIKRRYGRGLANLVTWFKELSDSWQVFDASGAVPKLIAFGDKFDGDQVVDKALWKRLNS